MGTFLKSPQGDILTESRHCQIPGLAKAKPFAYARAGKVSMDYVKHARTVFDIEIDALRQTRARLDGSFSAAVELIA